MGKRPKEPPAPTPPAPFHAPFEGLRAKLGLPDAPAEPGPATESTRAATAPPHPGPLPPLAREERGAAPTKPGPARAVVRFERKGRGGKAVTVVEKLDPSPAELDRWLSELKRALGCGGAVEGDALVLQGDLRDRVRALLEARGVRKVTVG